MDAAAIFVSLSLADVVMMQLMRNNGTEPADGTEPDVTVNVAADATTARIIDTGLRRYAMLRV